MARHEIILAIPPKGEGGDPPRTASMKINAMTEELYQGNALISNSGWGGPQKLVDQFDFNSPPDYSTAFIGQNCLNGPAAGDFYITVQYLNDLNISVTARNIANNITYDRVKVGVWRPWRQAQAAGDFGIGLPLNSRAVSSIETPVARETGVSFDYLAQDLPPSGQDGALMTLGYSSNYAFQLFGDWRTGEVFTTSKAPPGQGPGRRWVRQYDQFNSLTDPQTAGGLISRIVVGALALSKFANGLQIINGTVGMTPDVGLGAIQPHRFELPFSAGLDAQFCQVSPIIQPVHSYDHYGAVSAYVEGQTTLLVVVRNGATAAQAFSIRAIIVGHWK